jgi:hypothetical protein
VSAPFDLMAGAFAADHTGFDKVLDRTTISSGAVTVTDGTVTQTSTVSASTKILARPPLAMPTNRRTSRRRGRRWRFVLTYFTPDSVLP